MGFLDEEFCASRADQAARITELELQLARAKEGFCYCSCGCHSIGAEKRYEQLLSLGEEMHDGFWNWERSIPDTNEENGALDKLEQAVRNWRAANSKV